MLALPPWRWSLVSALIFLVGCGDSSAPSLRPLPMAPVVTSGAGGGTTGAGGGTTGAGRGTTANGGGTSGTGGGTSGTGGGTTGTGGGTTGTGGGTTGTGGGTTGTGGGTTGTGGGSVSSEPFADLRADVDRNGDTSLTAASDDTNEDTWDETHGAIFMANLDVDDTSRCQYNASASDDALAACNDASDEVVNGTADLDDMALLKVAPWPSAPAGAEGHLGVGGQGAAGAIRLFKRSGNSYVVFNPATDLFSTAELRAGIELRLEGKDIVRSSSWSGFVDLTLMVTSGSTTARDTVRLRVAPLIFFHHLLPAETAYVTRVPAGSWGQSLSTSFTTALRNLLTAQQVAAPLVEVSTSDVWAQDYFETAYMSMPGPNGAQHTMRVNVRSANVQSTSTTKPLRPAGRMVFSARGPGVAAVQQYSRNASTADTLNSFGNFETIPPFTLGNATYPLGRVLRGSISSYHPDSTFKTMVESQLMQPPVYVDTSWLLVGHVDETMSFVKVATPRGWTLMINDARLAVQMLQQLANNGGGSTQMFIGKQWDTTTSATATVQQVLNDTEVMSESASAAVKVDGQLAIVKAATGLTDAEIIRVPFLHMPIDGSSIAYQPGMVNGFYVNTSTFIAPNPFGPIVSGKDIFASAVEQSLAAHNITVKWIDDWDLYHVNMGEVHCGTNAARAIPSVRWWETGR